MHAFIPTEYGARLIYIVNISSLLEKLSNYKWLRNII